MQERQALGDRPRQGLQLLTNGCLRVQVAHQIGQGLAALHRKGIIHRDMKPQNVLLTDDYTARISDMGLCKRLTNDQSYAESTTIGEHAGHVGAHRSPALVVHLTAPQHLQGMDITIGPHRYRLLLCPCTKLKAVSRHSDACILSAAPKPPPVPASQPATGCRLAADACPSRPGGSSLQALCHWIIASTTS